LRVCASARRWKFPHPVGSSGAWRQAEPTERAALWWVSRCGLFPDAPAGSGEAGRPTGFAAVGLLQVRACALIPFGDWLRQPCVSLARGQGDCVPWTSLDQTCLRQVAALAARRFRCASASGGAAVFLCSSLSPVTLRLRCRVTGCACKGVFITLARYECFPLAPPSPPSLSFTGRRTQENGGQLRVGGRCEPEPFLEGL